MTITGPHPTWGALNERLAGVLDALLAAGAATAGSPDDLDTVMRLHAEVQQRGRDEGWTTPAAPEVTSRVAAAEQAAAGVTVEHADYRIPAAGEFERVGEVLADRGVGPLADLPDALRNRISQAVADATDVADAADVTDDGDRGGPRS